MLSIDDSFELLGILHSTTLQPERWETFLQRLSQCTGSEHSFVLSSSATGTSVLGHGGAGRAPGAERIYDGCRGSADPFGGALLLHPKTGVLDGDELVPETTLLSSQMYRSSLEPCGLRFLTMMALSATPKRMEALSVWRAADQGSMREDQKQLLKLLMPHVQVALNVRKKLRSSSERLANAETLLDRTACATILLEGQGKVTHCNEPATILLQMGLGLEVRKGKLCATDRVADSKLQLLLQPTHPSWRPATGGALTMERPRGGGARLQIVATPVGVTGPDPRKSSMMVVISDPSTHVKLPDGVLRGLFGLTPAECEVANAYLGGGTSEEIATVREVSVCTVRSQLKVLLQKTGAKRQSDLIRLLLTLPVNSRNTVQTMH